MEEEEVGNQKTRDFICACGKNYLSYAALFTHIKQKHDGKAPGPIVRPRSERKRGRPRKNPLNDQEDKNSESDIDNNGISFNNQINNNNINIFQKKAKQAAQLLGCGQFQAFQAYKPDNQSSLKIKSQKQDIKKPSLKKYSSNTERNNKNTSKDDSGSNNEIPPKSLKMSKSGQSGNKDVRNERNSYHYNFVIQQIKSIFKDYQPSEQEYSCRQIIQIFDCFNQSINEEQQSDQIKKISIQYGFQLFLEEIQNHLYQFQYKQISFLLSLFYVYISEQIGKPSNSMRLGIQISQFTKYVSPFLYNQLQKKIQDLSVGCLFIFQDLNFSKIMMILCNWLAIKQTPEISLITNCSLSDLNEPKPKKEKRNYSKQTTEQKKQQKQQRNQKIQSQDDVKFQQLNSVLERVRISRLKTKQQEKNIKKQKQKKNKKVRSEKYNQIQQNQNIQQQFLKQQISDLSNQQQFNEQSYQLQEEQQNSQQESQCMQAKNEPNKGKAIISEQ